MAFTFTDHNKKVVLHSWGRFKAVLYEAVAVGDLLAMYGSASTTAMRLADASSGYAAVAVACEDGIAGQEISCALAAELKAPVSVGTGGATTQTYFCGATDYLGSQLYLGASGKAGSASGTTVQGVGFCMARDTIMLVPGGSITGAAGSFTTLAASSTLQVTGDTTLTGNNTSTGTLTQTGVATFAAQDIHTLGLKVTTTAPIIGGVIVPKMLATAKTSGSGAWALSVAEFLGGFIIDATTSAGSAPTMPTVAAVVAALPGYIAGSTILLVFKNTGTQTATLTTDASAQWTMEGIMTIVTKETRMFLCRIESGTAGTVYSIGHSTTTT